MEARSPLTRPPARHAPRLAFHLRLFACALRYKSIHGHGFQAAVPAAAMAALRAQLGTRAELFASPFNCYFGSFCSAFADVDASFGSSGNFFGAALARIEAGSFECNPPFSQAILDAAARGVCDLLARAAAGGRRLTVVFVSPAWQGSGMKLLREESPFTRHAMALTRGEHGFRDGASHQPSKRRARLRASPYDSFVFVLMTDAARAAFEASGRTFAALERDVRGAMVMR